MTHNRRWNQMPEEHDTKSRMTQPEVEDDQTGRWPKMEDDKKTARLLKMEGDQTGSWCIWYVCKRSEQLVASIRN